MYIANQPTSSKTGRRFVPSDDDEDDESEEEEEEEDDESEEDGTNHYKSNIAKSMASIPPVQKTPTVHKTPPVPMIPPTFADKKSKEITKRVIEPSDDENSEESDEESEEDSDEEQITNEQPKGKDKTRGKYMPYNPDDN